jgi:hypothetical protein
MCRCVCCVLCVALYMLCHAPSNTPATHPQHTHNTPREFTPNTQAKPSAPPRIVRLHRLLPGQRHRGSVLVGDWVVVQGVVGQAALVEGGGGAAGRGALRVARGAGRGAEVEGACGSCRVTRASAAGDCAQAARE